MNEQNVNKENVIRVKDAKGDDMLIHLDENGKAIYEDAKKYLASYELKTRNEWTNFKKSLEENWPSFIPKKADRYYRRLSVWGLWGDFLSNGNKSNRCKEFASYERAKEILKELKIEGSSIYHKLLKEGKLPKELPYSPEKVYKDEFVNWTDYLSYESPHTKHEYTDFLTARNYIHSLNISSQFEYFSLAREKKLRLDIPHSPQKVYAKSGWVSWYDWLNKSKSDSSGENFVAKKLEESNYNFIRQKTFDWLGKQSIDIFLTDLNLAIEVQGEQHFREIEHFGGKEKFTRMVELDEQKFKLCSENNVTLIYFVFDKYIKIPQEFLDQYEYIRDIDTLISKIKEYE